MFRVVFIIIPPLPEGGWGYAVLPVLIDCVSCSIYYYTPAPQRGMRVCCFTSVLIDCVSCSIYYYTPRSPKGEEGMLFYLCFNWLCFCSIYYYTPAPRRERRVCCFTSVLIDCVSCSIYYLIHYVSCSIYYLMTINVFSIRTVNIIYYYTFIDIYRR